MFLLTSCDDGIPNEYFVDPKVADELGSTRLAWEKNVPSNLHSLYLAAFQTDNFHTRYTLTMPSDP